MADAVVLEADPAIGAGERCSWGRRAQALASAAGEGDPTTWHAAVTHQGCEALAQERLQARGIDTVLPMVRYWRVRHRQRFVDQRPLIAGVVLFGLDRTRRALVDSVADVERADRGEGAEQAGPLPIERVVRGASNRWAVLPTEDVWGLRRAILRGDFDATLREGRPGLILPPLIQWLLQNGDLPPEAAFTHREARRRGLKFSVAA